jgi:adenine-specific DNA-methyltransferase
MTALSVSAKFDASVDAVLYQGNTLDLLKSLPQRLARLVVTSPPYNIGKSYETKASIEEYLSFQKTVIQECARIVDDRGSICWQVGNYVDNGEIIPLDVILYPIFSSFGLHLRNRIVWSFAHGLHSSRRFSGRYEVILWFTKGNDYVFNLDAVRVPQKYPQKRYFKGPKKGQLSGNPLGKNPGDVWEIPNVKANHVEKTVHPCQFPVELVERLVLSLTCEGDWVLDPFAGVGSTHIAALMHKRKAIGAEIVPEYVGIAKERIALAQQGALRVRPMERTVYDPCSSAGSVPPKLVSLGRVQPRLMEERERYAARGGE